MARKKVKSLINRLNTEQTEGVFTVPPEVEEILLKNRVVSNWVDAYTAAYDPDKSICVIEEEKYSKLGTRKLFGIHPKNEEPMDDLCNYGFTRPSKRHQSDNLHKYQDTLSIAQTLSWALHTKGIEVPIEDILTPLDYFEGKEFRRLSKEQRIEYLFQAYKGVSWFEEFVTVTKDMTNKLKKGRKIKRMEVADFLEIDGELKGRFAKLTTYGLLMPEVGEDFPHKGQQNFVHYGAFVTLISLIRNCSIDEVEEAIDDELITHIVESYKTKVISYAETKGIDLDQEYGITDCSLLTGLNNRPLTKAASSERMIGRKEEGKWIVKGRNLVAYALTQPLIQAYTKQQFAELLGCEEEIIDALDFKTKNGKYSRSDHVWPFYQDIVARAMQELSEGEVVEDLSLPTLQDNLLEEIPKELVTAFAGSKLISRLEIWGIDPEKEYSLRQIKKILDKKTIKETDKTLSLKGIDWLVHSLYTPRESFTKDQVELLFAIRSNQVDTYGFVANPSGEYDGEGILPVYETVAAQARGLVLNGPWNKDVFNPIELCGTEYYVTSCAKKKYCSLTGESDFDVLWDSIRDYASNAKEERDHGNDEKVFTSPGLIFETEGNAITSLLLPEIGTPHRGNGGGRRVSVSAHEPTVGSLSVSSFSY